MLHCLRLEYMTKHAWIPVNVPSLVHVGGTRFDEEVLRRLQQQGYNRSTVVSQVLDGSCTQHTAAYHLTLQARLQQKGSSSPHRMLQPAAAVPSVAASNTAMMPPPSVGQHQSHSTQLQMQQAAPAHAWAYQVNQGQARVLQARAECQQQVMYSPQPVYAAAS